MTHNQISTTQSTAALRRVPYRRPAQGNLQNTKFSLRNKFNPDPICKTQTNEESDIEDSPSHWEPTNQGGTLAAPRILSTNTDGTTQRSFLEMQSD